MFPTTTTLDKYNESWISKAKIPLGLFNVDDGKAKGTEWRMNFFRTVTSPETFPNQTLGGKFYLCFARIAEVDVSMDAD